MSAALTRLSAASVKQCTSLLLTHEAFTAAPLNRQSVSLKGRKPLPSTRTTVPPVISPLLGLSESTCSRS